MYRPHQAQPRRRWLWRRFGKKEKTKKFRRFSSSKQQVVWAFWVWCVVFFWVFTSLKLVILELRSNSRISFCLALNKTRSSKPLASRMTGNRVSGCGVFLGFLWCVVFYFIVLPSPLPSVRLERDKASKKRNSNQCDDKTQLKLDYRHARRKCQV